MSDWQNNLLIAQVISLGLATVLILMQNRGSGLGSTFGGSDEIYLTRRGMEKSVVTLTIACIVIFAVLRIVSLFIA